jgi:Hsp20/alpha crystallin family
MQKDDVNIDIHNNILTVSGETKATAQRDEEGYTLRERRYGKFSRSISMPQGAKVSYEPSTLGANRFRPLEGGHQSEYGQRRPECHVPEICAGNITCQDYHRLIPPPLGQDNTKSTSTCDWWCWLRWAENDLVPLYDYLVRRVMTTDDDDRIL